MKRDQSRLLLQSPVSPLSLKGAQPLSCCRRHWLLLLHIFFLNGNNDELWGPCEKRVLLGRMYFNQTKKYRGEEEEEELGYKEVEAEMTRSYVCIPNPPPNKEWKDSIPRQQSVGGVGCRARFRWYHLFFFWLSQQIHLPSEKVGGISKAKSVPI